MGYFLLEFDGRTRPAKLTEFAELNAALDALAVRERVEPVGGETVLLFADSEAALRATHSRYFEGPLEGFQRVFNKKKREIDKMLAATL